MAKEEISFVLNSNLDKIANHAKILSQNVEDLHQAFKRKNAALIEQNKLESIAVEGIKKLADNYSKLNDNVSGVINNNKNFVNSFSNSASNLSTIDSIIDKLNNKLSGLNTNITNINQNPMSMQASTEGFENYWNTFKKIGNFIHDSIKYLLDGIHKMGVQLAIEATNLKPFALEFMSSFSFNPLKFFGFGEAMKQSFDLILKFQQMRHELAYLSDASGDASKALSLVYEIAGGSAVASGTAQGIIRALADQGIIANKELKSLGILSGNLQAATGIAASQWASFTGELAFNYGIPIGGLENITSALIGTNIRGAQLEKVMGTVNKVLQTTGFIAGVPTTESVHKLTKSIGGASKTFQALGISAEKSGAFIEGIMDPENFEKNAFMFAKLGISASEYAGYLNDADGQQKLLQKTMQNLPALASEISNIQNPFARIQYAKTIGLDMQIVQRMAGKTKAEIEDILANYEKENKAKEALEAKKQRMAAESAKFDDMMLALKLKVLAPVMKFLSSGYLDRFFAVLPSIAETIGKIFAAMTPIIEEVTRVLLDAMPYVTKLVDEWVVPFIKMFPQLVKSFLGLIGINEESTESNMAKVLEYLGIAAGVLAGWKAFTFIGDMVGKVTTFFSPNNKRLMDVPFNEYLKGMQSIQQPDGASGGGMGLLTKSLLAAGLIFGAGKLAKSYFSKENDTGINDGDFAERRAQSTTSSLIQNKMFGKGINYKTSVVEGSKTFGNFLSRKFLPNFDDIIPGGAPTPTPPKIPGKLGSFKGSLKALGPLGMAVTGYQIMTAENAEQLSGAIGGAIGGVIGSMGGAFLTPFIGPLGPIVGSALGSVLGDYVGSTIGKWIDDSQTQVKLVENRSALVKESLENGLSGIFAAFKAGDFQTLAKLISLSLENLYLEFKSKIMSFGLLSLFKEKEDVLASSVAQMLKMNFTSSIDNYKEQLAKGTFTPEKMAILNKSYAETIQQINNAGLTDETKTLLRNSIEMDFRTFDMQKKLAEQQLIETKKGTTVAENHYKLDKDKKTPPVEVKNINIDNFDFGRNIMPIVYGN